MISMSKASSIIGMAVFGAVLSAVPPARAQSSVGASTDPATAQSPANGFWTRPHLLGDLGGIRPFLATYGISLGLTETSEVWGNVTGGVHQGADYDGLTEMSLGLDTDKAFGWAGGTFNVSAFQIHGRTISSDNLHELHPLSSIEADRATRLWQLWYQQAFLDNRVDVKIGQQSIDQEFDLSQYAGLFLNAGFGWAVLPTNDLYASGPVYPLSSLGIRLRAHLAPALTALGGVFDDNPPGGPFANDSQLRDGEASGTRFNLNTGALWIGELQYAVNAAPAKACDNVACGLPGTYKLGGWYDTGGFPDQRIANDGLALADPASSGIPRTDRGNFSVYAVMDQMVWRAGPGDPRSIGIFVRPEGAPGDRNLIDFSIDAGVTLQAPFAGRDKDTLGIAYSYAKIGNAASGFDRDKAFFTGTSYPVRSGESVIELTYQAQITPWWQLQPDFQYIIDPGGGIQNPLVPSRSIGDEAVFGLRTVITF